MRNDSMINSIIFIVWLFKIKKALAPGNQGKNNKKKRKH